MFNKTKSNTTITVTWGDRAENHSGMQMIGEMASIGFTKKDLELAKQKFETTNQCELIELDELLNQDTLDKYPDLQDASLLIIKDGVNTLLSDIGKTKQELYLELDSLEPDKKAFMYGRVVNKHARYNLCFSDTAQEPDYQNKKGRVVAFNDIPLTNYIRKKLPEYFGEKAKDLQAEENYYYDVNKCGIGFHGDAERRIVIGMRLGANMPMHYHWFLRNKPIGQRLHLLFTDGDLYLMSQKTTGYDWKKTLIPTLRHAAGCTKFTTIK